MLNDFGVFKLLPVDSLPRHVLSFARARLGSYNIGVAVTGHLVVFLLLDGCPLFSWKAVSSKAAWSRFRSVCRQISDVWSSSWQP